MLKESSNDGNEYHEMYEYARKGYCFRHTVTPSRSGIKTV